MKSDFVAKTGFRLLGSNDPTAIVTRVARTTGTYHCAGPESSICRGVSFLSQEKGVMEKVLTNLDPQNKSFVAHAFPDHFP